MHKDKKMFYLIYQTTNLVNGKIYIGKHKTSNLDDGYLGSGSLLKKAISKYGVENFKKEILYILDTVEEMNLKEKELVTKEFVSNKNTYNLRLGGEGGFDYIHANAISIQTRLKISKALKGRKGTFLGKKHSSHTKKLISELAKQQTHSAERRYKHSEIMKIKSKGSNNSQFGTMWITNGVSNKKIKKDEPIPLNWYKGRTKIINSNQG